MLYFDELFDSSVMIGFPSVETCFGDEERSVWVFEGLAGVVVAAAEWGEFGAVAFAMVCEREVVREPEPEPEPVFRV